MVTKGGRKKKKMDLTWVWWKNSRLHNYLYTTVKSYT
jgi:hypothetical protein